MDAESIEIFLNLVGNYPELYAVSHVDYKNTLKKEVAWREIKEKTGIDVKSLKAKWRNLRDTYKKYRQSHKTSSGQAKKLANWIWAEHMSFMESPRKRKVEFDPLDTGRILLDTSTPNIKTENENETFIETEQAPRNKNDLKLVIEPGATQINARKRIILKRRQQRVTNNDKIKNYLKIRRTPKGNTGTNATNNLVNVACDRIDMEFLGYANTVKTLSLRLQAIVKLQITKLITHAQLQELDNSRPNSASSNASSSHTINEDSDTSRPIELIEQQDNDAKLDDHLFD